MSQLFTPITLGQKNLANRIVISPMCQYSAIDGRASDWHIIHLGHLALSGAGLMFIEATAVTPEGRISPDDLGLWNDDTEAALDQVLKSIRQYSPIPIGIQLAHAGRKASTRVPWEGGSQIAPNAGGWQTVSSSNLPWAAEDHAPLALDDEGLQHVRTAFANAARRAVRLGLDVIELHAAHGYLLHQFLSPLSNQRDDQYGGSLENRMRFPLEVFDAIRAVVPAWIPLGVRISATDWVKGGWDLEQSIVFCQALEQKGCEFIDASSGGLSPDQKIPLTAGYQVPFAEQIRQKTGIPIIAVGMITEPEHAEQIITSGQADMVALARGMLYDPRWPWHAAAKLGAQVDAPRQYWRSHPAALNNLFKR